MNPVPRLCRYCNKSLKGRADKKFCDDYCRNNFNNRLKAETNNQIRNINYALGKNRRILESLLPGGSGTFKISREQLLQLGFQFRYFTHLHTSKKGNTCYYCYEYGYMPIERDICILVKRPLKTEEPGKLR